MNKLRECPFCEGTAFFERKGDSRRSTIVQCEYCCATLENGEEFRHGAAWNKRPVEDRLRARIVELEALLAAMMEQA